ncbi:hypothetical protein NM688_g5731 [Phlebia brevispora]|uniref:Uncharacterized protein n=1 Tax=Phlebia brevispora TaxID=194682 RepID=A0ACC1SQX5_9APHY|nr:hypothetical protein NM688_g5731 [Phlebia brevispora]
MSAGDGSSTPALVPSADIVERIHGTIEDYIAQSAKQNMLQRVPFLILHELFLKRMLKLPENTLDEDPVLKAVATKAAYIAEELLQTTAQASAKLRTGLQAARNWALSSDTELPVDVIFNVSRYLTNKSDLKALSLACRQFAKPAQKELFRSIRHIVPPGREACDDLMNFLTTKKHLARFVKTFTLRGETLDWPSSFDVGKVQKIVQCLPALEQLTISAVDWTPTPGLGDSERAEFHSSLKRLCLLGIVIKHRNCSPLQLLRLANSWDRVELEYLDHPPGCVEPVDDAVSTNVLVIQHFLIHDTSETLPHDSHSFKDVVSLTVQYILDTQLPALEAIVRNSTHTLRNLSLRVTHVFSFGGADDWADLLDALKQCNHLTKVAIHGSLHCHVPPASNLQTRIQLLFEFILGVISVTRSSTRFFDFVFELRGRNVSEIVRSFRSMDWPRLGQEIELASNVDIVRIMLTSTSVLSEQVRLTQYDVLRDSFRSFGVHEGYFRDGFLVLYKSRVTWEFVLRALVYDPQTTGAEFGG